MRLFLSAFAAASVLTLAAAVSLAAGSKDQNGGVSGVLIDQACGSKMMAKADPEKAAAGHPKSCATKDACAASGYAVISGKQMLKFDDNGNKLAKEFLAKTDKTKDIRVHVEGTEKGDQIAVTSITAAGDQK
ncbi:MAG TPA: hypothetical protein VLJ39_21250 [Tepidisphaeraceae bacterium]|nr:hypothetical protein [Tepidisphaeraceae bacterium]